MERVRARLKRVALARSLGALLISAAVSGCGGLRPVPVPKIERNSASFFIGREMERNVGELMVIEENLLFFMAPVAVDDYRPPTQLGTTYPPITKGMIFTPYGRLDNGDTLYTHHDFRPVDMYGKPVPWDYCIAIDKDGKAYGDAACIVAMVRRWEGAPEPLIEIRRVYKEGSVRRELMYNGRLGNVIKIGYREYRYDKNRPAFYQELAYDLAESATVVFRKMRIEVVNATGSSIRFVVKSTMDGSSRLKEGTFSEALEKEIPHASGI